MPNPENLTKLTPEQRSARTAKGNHTRAEKRALREIAQEILDTPLTPEQIKRLKRKGICVDKLPKEYRTNGYAMMAGQIAAAIAGDTPAAKFTAELTGDYNAKMDINVQETPKLDAILSQVGGEGLDE